MKLIQIHPSDNVAIALSPIAQGETFTVSGRQITAVEDIPQGHKMALMPIHKDALIIKYGNPIGRTTAAIGTGAWVHTHNVRTTLSESEDYVYHHKQFPLPEVEPKTFLGYRRPDGRAAIRNELWIIPTVGCVNSIAQHLVQINQHLVSGTVEGLYAFPHPFGCSQMGDDHAQTRKLLAALACHPNAAGVLVLGLGCENLTMQQFKDELSHWDDKRIKFLICQEVEDEIAAGSTLLSKLAEYAATFKRKPLPPSDLVIGMKCGGSDGLSGITANPAVGRFSDRLVALGGSTILTEVPEMFGAESILLDRCESQSVFDQAVKMISDFKQYYVNHGQVVYENPSPGNKAGGITTLEDKSCGCVQKGGSAQIVDVLNYGDVVTKKGLNVLSGPGNDLVSATALTAAGAHLVLFTTGRGTPFGAPAPTVKISTNTPLFEKKGNWIDFNAGTIAQGEALDDAGDRLLAYVLAVASGEQTKTERSCAREIAIFKDGVML
ncbi:MAG TPA: altronate dehydratase family protein [Clostridia bacterium]|nr:altronate dehydratase family protein [Clostridia bacterium]